MKALLRYSYIQNSDNLLWYDNFYAQKIKAGMCLTAQGLLKIHISLPKLKTKFGYLIDTMFNKNPKPEQIYNKLTYFLPELPTCNTNFNATLELCTLSQLSGYYIWICHALFLSQWVWYVLTSWLPFKCKKFKYPGALIFHRAGVSDLEICRLTG
jgi:hypothetical protein